MSVPVRALESFQSAERRFSRIEIISASGYAITLLWINAYICRGFFTNQTAYMNSMHGFWTAIALHAGGGWFQANWWPYWDLGIPLEFTYAPLVPALTSIWANLRCIPPVLAFQSITGLVYCLAPFTLFLMAWLMTRAPGYSFAAALFYSVTAPAQLILPDAKFELRNFWDAHRFYTVAIWDDTPHLTALAFLPLIILFLSLSIRRRRMIYYAAAAVSIALAALSSAFGVAMVTMAAVCLVFVLGRENLRTNAALTILIGAYAWALIAPFLSPSLLLAIRAASASHDGGWSMGSVTAVAMVVAAWAILWRYLPRWTRDWRLQFFAFFALLAGSAPVMAIYLHRQFLPQPLRYKLELELGLSMLVVFGTRWWFDKLPLLVKSPLLLLLLALAAEQIVSHRKYAKDVLYPHDLTQTIEYRAASWAGQNLPGVRVMLPGSIAQWANAFTELPQFAGSSWSMAYSGAQQLALAGIYNGGETQEQDAHVSLTWLQAFGAGAIAISGPQSQEVWKPYAHPGKFEGILPVLWRADDVTIYRVPQRTTSLAHVVPERALVNQAPRSPRDIAGIEPYAAALEDPSLPLADMRWEGRNRMHIQSTAQPGQVVSVQVSYHPGWHASVGGRRRDLKSDGLGLMWLRPECTGLCDVALEYDGGWELRLCRYTSWLALAGLLVIPLAARWHRLQPVC